MISFGLVWFYSISTIVGYLVLNPVFTYIENRRKITISEIQNHSNTHTHTHNDKNITNTKEG